MHPLNIPELATLMKNLKSHVPVVDGETDERIDKILFKLMMYSSFEPSKKAKIYNLDRYRKLRGNK